MSNIYKVLDNKLGKVWCLKEIKKTGTKESDLEYRSLIQEANIMKYLNHPSIPRIVTIDEADHSIFILMDYIEGNDIKKIVRKSGPFSPRKTLDISKQICEVLIYLHNLENPVFYRDMKPSNVVLQEDGKIKVLDFGISLVLKGGDKINEPLGTKGYSPPEQAKKGNECDLRSDIYALGMTMYYMLTGINPKTIKDGLKPISLASTVYNGDLNRVIYKCIEVDINNRYNSVEEVLSDLENCNVIEKSVQRKNISKKAIIMGSVAAVVSLFCIVGFSLVFNKSLLFGLLLAWVVAIVVTGVVFFGAVRGKNMRLLDASEQHDDSELLDLVPDNHEVCNSIQSREKERDIFVIEEYSNI
jgi:serine/threonine-protein kinase